MSVSSVAFTPDDRGLISGSYDGKLKHWDLTPFLQCDVRLEPLLAAMSSAPLPASSPGPRAVLPPKEGGERGSICTLTFDGHTNWVRSSPVCSDGQWVVSGSDDKSVLFWDMRNAQAQFALHGHNHWINSVDVSPIEGVFACGDYDGITRICEVYFGIYRDIYSDPE